MIVRRIDGEYRAFGTPWPGDAGIARNESVPLSGILFLCHGTSNRIEPLTLREAVEKAPAGDLGALVMTAR